MDKEWYIVVEGKREGPFSYLELKRDFRITPDTLVWKAGYKDWIAIRYVTELKDLFKDEPEGKPLHENEKTISSKELFQEQEALTLQRDPFQFFLWVLVLILLILYLFYVFYNS